MCGIYGSTIEYSQQQVKEKLDRTRFRGPDQQEIRFYGDDLILGHNRLSIIDLDPRSNQPFKYEHLHVVFNGEIFNFQELKRQLTARGYAFRTTSDTEVLCAAYLEYGSECTSHFNGMFAFVIYDEKNKTLFGARDRLGQKPFYYYHNGKDFEFSSQISSIQIFHKNLNISKKSIGYYLGWGYIPDPFSIFEEIKKLKAGHCFNFNLITGEFKEEAYWDIDYLGESRFKGSYREAMEELDYLLTDSTKLRLFADVPVGVFLSGGVDSSLIASLVSKNNGQRAKTFNVKFKEQGFDESAFARKVASHLGTEHHEIECSIDEGLQLIGDFSHYYDEPFADSSAIPTMLLSKLTREHVTVALSGDAGDETFIGYSRYKPNPALNVFNYPLAARKVIAKLSSLSPRYRTGVIAKALRLRDFNQYYLTSFIGIDHDWLKLDFDVLDVEEKIYLEHHAKDRYERMANFDLKTYLNWDINTKVDRASMAFSLEARSPIMDYRVVELANSFPREFKLNGGNLKRILKDVLYQYCPKEFFNRPKAGFTMPFSEWFRKELKDMVLTELGPSGLKDIPMIDEANVSFRIQQHMSGEWDRYPLIWKLLVLKQWLHKNSQTHSLN